MGGPAASRRRTQQPPLATSRYRVVPHAEAMALLPAILDIEYQVYEPARRTPPAEIRAAIEDAEGSLLVAEAPGPHGGAQQLVGFAIGAPLEQSKDVEGCDDDPMLGKHNTMYSVSITVAPSYQSSGIGRKLKELQLRDALARKRRRRHAALPLRHRPQPRRPHRADDAPQPRVRRARRLGPHRPVRGSRKGRRSTTGSRSAPFAPDPVVKQDVAPHGAADVAGDDARSSSISRRA